MPLKKVLSFTKLADMMSPPTAQGEDGKASPGDNKSRKERREQRRRKDSRSPKRHSHNDLCRLGEECKKAEENRKSSGKKVKKRSSTNDLSRLMSSRPSNQNLGALGTEDVNDIFDMVQQLKESNEGKKLLSEFVDYQTGKSSQKPKILGVPLDDDDDDLFLGAPPVSEIVIGGKSA